MTAAVLHGHRGEDPEGGVLEDRGKHFVLLPDAVLEVAEDDDAGLGTIGREVLIPLDGHGAHGGDDFGNALGEATKTAILLEGDLYKGIVGDQTILFLHVGFVPGGAVDEILMEGLEEEQRTYT